MPPNRFLLFPLRGHSKVFDCLCGIVGQEQLKMDRCLIDLPNSEEEPELPRSKPRLARRR